jgi:hypothetical protein
MPTPRSPPPSGLNGWYGGYDGQPDASSPLAHVRPDAPPFLVAHGDHDTVAPAEVAFELVVDAIETFTAWVRSREARSGHDLWLEY